MSILGLVGFVNSDYLGFLFSGNLWADWLSAMSKKKPFFPMAEFLVIFIISMILIRIGRAGFEKSNGILHF